MKKRQIVAGLIAAYLLFLGFMNTRTIIIIGYQKYTTYWRNDFYLLVWFFAVGGLVQFIGSGYKNSLLLQIWLFFSLMGHLVFIPIAIIRTNLFHKNSTYLFAYPVWIFVQVIVALILGYYCLIVLSRTRTAVLEEVESLDLDGDKMYVFHNADRWTRLANSLLDRGVVILFLVLYWPTLNLESEYSAPYVFASPLIGVVFGAFLFFYYLLLESVAGSSFGKLITNTVIVNASGQRPSAGQMIGRSFCRLIPFDGLSFLVRERGWHDTLSRTHVTKGKFDAP